MKHFLVVVDMQKDFVDGALGTPEAASIVPEVIEKIRAQIAPLGVQRIVVGLPRNMDGSFGERAQKCQAFAAELQTATGIETVTWDERLTTVAAHRALSDVNVRGKKRKAVVDAVSAVMILEDYLKSKH